MSQTLINNTLNSNKNIYNISNFIVLKEKDIFQNENDLDMHINIPVNGLFGLKEFQINKSLYFNNPNSNPSSTNLKKINLKKDGLYYDEMNTDNLNILRLEQRLLNLNQINYFRSDNNELLLELNFKEEFLFKNINLEILENEFISTIDTENVLSINSYNSKNKLFEFEIVIDKIFIDVLPLFKREELLGNKLKVKYAKYLKLKEKTKITNIRNSLTLLKLKENDYFSNNINNEKYLIKLREQFIHLKELLESEVKDNCKIITDIIELWNEIKSERTKNNETINFPYNIYFNKYINQNDLNDVEVIIKEVSSDINDIKDLEESKRRINIKNIIIYYEVYIDNKYLYKSKKYNLSWPYFIIEIKENIRLLIHSKPNNIKIKLYQCKFLKNEFISEITIDIPGDYNLTFNSVNIVVNDVKFSNLITKDNLNDNNNKYETINNNEDNNIIMNNSVISKDYLFQEYNLKHNFIKGRIRVQMEWKPIENLLPINNILNNINHNEFIENSLTNFEDNKKNIIDLNKPQDAYNFSKIKYFGDEAKMNEMLKNDLLLRNSNIICLRHELIKLKYYDHNLIDIKIPISDNEILRNNNLLLYLKNKNNYDFDNIIIDKEVKYNFTVSNTNIIGTNKNTLVSSKEIPYDEQSSNRIKKLRRNLDIIIKKQKFNNKIGNNNLNFLKEVVNEYFADEQENIIVKLIKSLFEMKRKLRPKVVETKKVIEQVSQIDLSVYIFKISNIPLRLSVNNSINNNMLNNNSIINNSINNNNYLDQLSITNYFSNSFIKIKIINKDEEKVYYTDCNDGIDVNFNEKFTYTFKSNNKDENLNSEIIKNSKDSYIMISLFDKNENYSNKSNNPNKYTVLVENKYLGSLKIPLFSFLKSDNKSLFLKMNRPIFIYGYITKKESIISLTNNPVNCDYEMNNPFINTLISMSLISEPSIFTKTKSQNNFYSGFESQIFISFVSKFIKEKLSKNINQYYKIFGENSEGMSVFMPRFLCPTKPPGDMLLDITSYQRVLHFVSLIPFEYDDDGSSIFLNNQEFIDLKKGNYEEHAILLCNYFNYLDKYFNKEFDYKSVLLFGKEYLYGECTFVARINLKTLSVEIYNPITGECFVIIRQEFEIGFFFSKSKMYKNKFIKDNDNVVSIYEVYSIVDDENIYFNNGDTNINEIDFNLNNTKQWVKLLDQGNKQKYFPNGIDKINDNDIIYTTPDQHFIISLEKQITEYIAKKIEDLRLICLENRPLQTKYNKRLNDLIKNELLIAFENYKYTIKSNGIDEFNINENKIKAQNEIITIKNKISDSISNTQDVFGFPLHFNSIEVADIWEEVKNTEIYNIFSDDIEFVLSCKIFEYPNYITSVWVYIAAIYNNY